VESQVKERIVGAAVLVALGVWLIPWVLDGTDEAPAEPEVSERLTLPAVEESSAPVRTETIELEPGASVPEVVAETATEETEAAADTPAESAGDTGPVASEESAGESGTRSPQPLADAGEAAPTHPPPAREVPAGGWSVQLGAYSELANADQIVSRVRTYGFEASVSEVLSGGQTLHRVRVVGFEGESQAEAAASSLSAHGFRPRVIPPEE